MDVDVDVEMGLSSSVRSDDDGDMRATLSQTTGGAATPVWIAWSVGIGLLAIVCACDSGDADSRAVDAATTDAVAATSADQTDGATQIAARGERAQNFEWPVDPNHPVLEIEVAAIHDEKGHVASGTIRVELMPELAPETVERIQTLANADYYDGTTFHRVIPGFMIQGGDPNSRDRNPSNDGKGRPDEPVVDEFGDAPFLRGVVGIGHKGREGTAGNQFFIMQSDDHSLDGRYTAIGRVVAGMDLVDAISQVEVDRTGRWGPKNRPIENVVMQHVSIAGSVGELATRGLAVANPEADGQQTLD